MFYCRLWNPTHTLMDRLLGMIRCYQKTENDYFVGCAGVHNAIRCSLFVMETWEDVSTETVDDVGSGLEKCLQEILDNFVESDVVTPEEFQVKSSAIKHVRNMYCYYLISFTLSFSCISLLLIGFISSMLNVK